MEITLQFCFALIVGSFIAVAAMASDPTAPRKRAPIQYVYIVNGTEYNTKLEALKAALANGKSSIHQCKEKGLADLVRK